MKKIMLSGQDRASNIYIGGNLEDVFSLCKSKNVVVITDRNVDALYGDRFSGIKKIVIKNGEANKTLNTVWDVYNSLLKYECQRDTMIIGIGGGIVCDITGFVASTYLRGLSFGLVATTLLAQVDAAIGGKNGVNLNGYKNIIGTINQPNFIICDLTTLRTLPKHELTNGMAELIKHALIGDRELFYEIEENKKAFLNLDIHRIEDLIFRSLKVKVDIVTRDETEKHERRKLNFGHTYGHAIELREGLKHGEAVSIGMVLEASLSISRGFLSLEELENMKILLNFFGLPVKIDCSQKDMIMDAILKDKKREGNGIYSVLLKGVGNSVIEKVKLNEIRELFNDMYKL